MHKNKQKYKYKYKWQSKRKQSPVIPPSTPTDIPHMQHCPKSLKRNILKERLSLNKTISFFLSGLIVPPIKVNHSTTNLKLNSRSMHKLEELYTIHQWRRWLWWLWWWWCWQWWWWPMVMMRMMMMMKTKSLPPGPVHRTLGVGLPCTSHLHHHHHRHH